MTTIFDVAGLTGPTRRRVTHAGETAAVSVQRDYAFPAEDLWSAWTRPERLARWLGVVDGEPTPGATVRLSLSAAVDDVATVTVLVCEPPSRLIVKWEWPGEPDSFVDLRIDASDDGHSRLHLEHVALVSGTALEHGCGWDDFLLRAEMFLEGVDPRLLTSAAVLPTVRPFWESLVEGAATDIRWPVIEGSSPGQVLRASRSIPSPISDVWAALTDADSISRWFGETTGELSVSGEFAVSFDGGGATGAVRSCTPMSEFEVRWTWDHDGLDTTVRVTLEPTDEGTLIQVVQTGVAGAATGYAAGWSAYLGALERALAGLARSEDMWQAEWTVARSMAHAVPS